MEYFSNCTDQASHMHNSSSPNVISHNNIHLPINHNSLAFSNFPIHAENSKSFDPSNCRPLNLMPLSYAKRILAEEHKLFLEGHTEAILSILVSSDNKFLYSNSTDGTIRIWSLQTMRQEAVLEEYAQYRSRVLLGCSHKFLISCSNGNQAYHDMIVWNIKRKTCAAILKNIPKPVICVAFTRDNKYSVFGLGYSTIRIFNLQSNTLEAVLKGYERSSNTLLITSDDKYIVSSDGNTVRIWYLHEKSEETVLQGHTGEICYLLLSRDDKYIISSSNDNTVRIWNFAKRRQLGVLKGFKTKVTHISITNDNKYIITVCDAAKKIIIWDLSERRQVAILAGHDSVISKVVITKDDKYILSSCSDSVRVWSIHKKREIFAIYESFCGLNTFAITSAYEYYINYSIRSDYNYSYREYSDMNLLEVWNIRKRRREGLLSICTPAVSCLVITDDMKYVVFAATDRIMRIWNIKFKREDFIILGHNKEIYTLAIHSNGKLLVSCSLDFIIKIWNFAAIRRIIHNISE